MNHVTICQLPFLLVSVAAGFVSLSKSDAASIAFISHPAEKQRHRPREMTHVCMNDIDIPIIFEDDRLLAIVKPHNVSHHDDPSTGQLGIMSQIRLRQQQPNPSFSYPHRLYGVHRLDRVTSGILLLAKDSATAGELIEKFRKKEVTKYYMAISGKKPTKKKQGWVKGIMTMGRRGSYKLINNSNQSKGGDEAKADDEIRSNKMSKKKNNGFAVTRFYTAGLGNLPLSAALGSDGLKHGKEDSRISPKTAILFQPYTGKTHQLRVAAKSVSMPILGDDRYGGGCLETSTSENSDGDVVHDWDRAYLHASAMHFRLEKDITIWSPPPFGHLFSESELDDVFVGLMKKHCDCTPILTAIHEAVTDKDKVVLKRNN